jgi:pilus assembly protein CpaE
MKKTIPGAVVSADAVFRETVVSTLRDLDRGIVVSVEITVPFAGLTAERIQELQRANADLLFLDLAEDTGRGIKLAQYLSENNPNLRIIAAGSTLAPEVLLSAMQAGVSEYLTKPVRPEALVEVLDRVQRKLVAPAQAQAESRTPAEVFTVFSVKGGCGTTTVATNLAVQLHQLTGRKTLLVDLDIELGTAAPLLGLQPRFSFLDMIRNLHRMDADLMKSYLEPHESGIHLLASPFSPDRTDAIPEDQIRKLLQFLREQYDYIVVDTPKSFWPGTVAALEEADRVFLVTVVDLPSLRNIKRFMPLLERASGRKEEKLRLVVNRYHRDGVITLEEVENTVGLKVHRTLCNDFESVIDSVNSGTPVVLNAKSAFAQDVRAFSMEIAGLDASKNGNHGPLKTLRRLFSRKKEVAADV